ncbi:hypothetical protein [Acinetobacter bereziniae]|uniref:hypothetical protein n=1 Tax=Acinetobacter bereziniae TaxID=106648 RepID=UPI002090F3C0|nr:hypothetical protein [Acinetobacter bereziniae]
MKKVISAITLSLSALIATSAMADWDHGRDHRPMASHEKFEWREGVILPERYHDNHYYVNDQKHSPYYVCFIHPLKLNAFLTLLFPRRVFLLKLTSDCSFYFQAH